MISITLWLLINLGTGAKVDEFFDLAECQRVAHEITQTYQRLNRVSFPLLQCIQAKVARP